MKKTILSALLLTLSASMLTAQAASLSFAEQLIMQKAQLHPQEFNFFSDRYKQVKAHESLAYPATFKTQLDSQKAILRDFNTYPASNASYQASIDVEMPTFKEQLDSQKALLRPQLFSFVSDAYNQVISR